LGGKGDYLILLTGLGDNSHFFDHFAYQFTDIYHVIGITRRGFGKSDKPLTGYSDSRRAQDCISILDNLGIASAVFAGHSIAGGELSELGVNHSSRVKKLVRRDKFLLNHWQYILWIKVTLTSKDFLNSQIKMLILLHGQKRI